MSLSFLPARLVEHLRMIYTPEELSIVEAGFTSERPCALRVNTLQTTPEEVEKEFAEINIPLQRVSQISLAYTVDRAHEYALKGSRS